MSTHREVVLVPACEHGSDFHWPIPLDGERGWWPEGNRYYGSGRDALRALLSFGKDRMGWQRLWLPSYFCQEVVASAVGVGLESLLYQDAPIQNAPEFPIADITPGDVVIVVNYFGLRKQMDNLTLRRRGAVVVEDHTHDPWSDWAQKSEADYCLASLRKTLPLPDGAVLWSPLNKALPPHIKVSVRRAQAAYTKFAAMVLKGLYMSGYAIEKLTFRKLTIDGESQIADGEISGISPLAKQLLAIFPCAAWRQRRLENWLHFRDTLGQMANVQLLEPSNDECDALPFCCVIVCNNKARREAIRIALITRNIYPAVLWPVGDAVLSSVPQEHVALGQSLLCLHCDMRYNADDMAHIAGAVKNANKGFKS